MEEELLIILENLKQFCTILLGQKLKIYTGHKSLIYKTLNDYQVLWWRLIQEEYTPDIKYITEMMSKDL